ncbi:chromosome partition protein Smc (plasmid) [Fischerella sp. NIES-4106]|nr:chromosome partition protein Smc [Fischerella sp. NIES-4106]
MQSVNGLKNKIFLASFGIGLGSVVAIFNPNEAIKNLGVMGVGGAVTSVIMAELVTSKSLSEVEKMVNGSKNELLDKTNQVTQLQRTIDKLVSESDRFKAVKLELEQQIEQANNIIVKRNLEFNGASQAISDLQQKLKDVGRFSTVEAYQIVRSTYNRAVKKLEGLVDALARNYPQVREDLDPIYIEVDSLRSRFTQRLEEYEALESFNELLDIGLELQERIIDKCVELKVKAQTVVIKYLSSIVNDSVPFSDYESHIQNLTNKAAEQIETSENIDFTLVLAHGVFPMWGCGVLWC